MTATGRERRFGALAVVGVVLGFSLSSTLAKFAGTPGVLIAFWRLALTTVVFALYLDTSEHSEGFGDVMVAIPAEFAAAVASGDGHPLDAPRGLHLQQLMATAMSQHAA